MAVEIKIPSVGESITEVTIGQWLKKDGEYVEKDETVVEIETDKVNQEISAPEAGILKITAKEGETIAVGAVAGNIEPGAKPAGNGAAAPPQATEKKQESASSAETNTAAAPKASSVAKKVAAEFGVSLSSVEGHGTGGRITKDDVLAAVESKNAPAKPAPAPSPAPAIKAAPGTRGERREKMSQLRKRIAQRLVEAQHTAAILTTFNEVDMSALMELRGKYKEGFQKKHAVGLGFMSFFVKASIEALKAFPRVNAYIENDEVVFHDYYDIGVAVGTEKGLVVPILRNAENLDFAGIEGTIKGFADKAKAGKLTLDDLSGGTFTISNGGVYGSMMSTPILNPPQSAILGMHNIIKRPIAVGDEVKIRPMMYLALSYDHRIIDGKEAVGFLVRIKECIEAPERMFLDV